MIALRRTNLGENHERFMRLLIIAVVPLLGLSGCEIVGDIFQAGVWVGVILVVGVIALIVWLVSRVKS